MPLSNPGLIVNPQISGTGAPTTVANTTTSGPALAANSARKGASFWNASTATVYLAFGATASATAYAVQLLAGGYYELPFGYQGLVSCMASAANGNLLVTEFT